MSGSLSRALALAVLAAAPVAAQQAPRDTARGSWLERVSVSARFAELRPAGRSEFYSLVDRALEPRSGVLRPRLAGCKQ